MDKSYVELKYVIEELGVHPALGPRGEGWGIEQNPHELATFLAAVPHEIETVLEIGTGYKAGLARFMAQFLGWQVTSVDIKDYGHSCPGVRFVVADSRALDLVEIDRIYDLVIIDGDHGYEAVMDDHDHYERLGSIIMFHDIAGERDCEGVARYWQEISRTGRGNLRIGFDEVIDQGSQRAGIGWYVK